MSDRQPGRGWRHLAGSTTVRFGVLVAIICGVGLVAGFAIAYPVSKIDLAGRTAVQLDQRALVGTFDPEQALVQDDDLPESWSQGDPSLQAFSLLGQPVCGDDVEIANTVGQKLVRTYADETNKDFVISEVVRTRKVENANQYIQDVEQAFTSCPGQRFFRTANGTRTEVRITNGQPNPPVDDYVSRTLAAPAGGTTQRLVFFEVGDVIVAIQYAGPTAPPLELLADIQQAVLARLVPKEFGLTEDVPGAESLPTEGPNSTTTAPPPPPSVPPTTEYVPTTTARKRRSATTTARPRPKPTTTAATPQSTAAPATSPTTAAAGGG